MSIWYPMTLQGEGSPPLKIERAEGDILYTEDGREIIDGISSWWTCIHGHRNPDIMQAIRNQTEKLDHVMLAGFTHRPAEELAEIVLDSCNRIFSHVFYSDNGSNAVEIALKIAHQYYRNKDGSRTRKTKFVRFSLSYHGDSIGALSVGGESVFTRIFRNLSFPCFEFPSPNCVNCPWGKEPTTCSTECLEQFRKFSDLRHEEITAVILEPLVSGANGMVFHSEKFLRELFHITREKRILLILDEVFTGLFRTGDWYAFQKAGIEPDLVCIAKGLTGGTLPLAMTLIQEEIYSAFVSSDPMKAFFHGHTMTGNPIACSAGIASLRILQEKGFDLLNDLESRLKQVAQELIEIHADSIQNMRVLGGILAFEVVQDLGPDEYLNPVGKKLREACIQRGALIRPLGNTVYLTPSYHISRENLDRLVRILSEVLDLL